MPTVPDLDEVQQIAALSNVSEAGRIRVRSIRTILALLVLATTLPLLALAGIMYMQMLSNQREAVRGALMGNAVTLAALVDHEVDAHIQFAGTLSTSVLLLGGDLEGFRQQAVRALKALPGASIHVADVDGRLLMSTSELPEGLLPRRLILEGARRAVESGMAQVTDVIAGAPAMHRVAFVFYPVLRDDKPLYTLIVPLSPERFLNLFRSKYRNDSTVGVLDRNLNFVARIPDHEARVGTPASEGWQQAIREAPQGVTEVTTLEGVNSLTGYAPTQIGWTVGTSNPTSVIEAGVIRVARSAGALSVVLTSGSLLLGYLVAQHLSTILRGLALASKRMGRGEIVDYAPTSLQEANQIRHALSDSSRELGRRAAATRESEARFRGTFENAAVGVAMVSPDGKWIETNERLCRLLGRERQALERLQLRDIVHPRDVVEFCRQFDEVVARRHDDYKHDLCFLRGDGEEIWVGVTLSAQLKPYGRPDYLILHVRDISKRIAAQTHQQFLLHELAHRSKNQLAVVRAMASQTARGAADVGDFMERFDKRTQGLAMSTDLLVSQGWRRASLRELVQRQTSLFGASAQRVRLEGPDIEVYAEAAEALGLAMHELGTNAVKYGALSNPTGVVDVKWRIESGADKRILRLEWRESGGPEVVAPTRKGFGSMVIERMVSQKIDATVNTDFRPEGFVWALEIPAKNFTLAAASVLAATPLQNVNAK